MPNYKIEWENLFEADTILDAAKQAFNDIKNHDTLYFTITDQDTGKRWSVDLNEDDEDAVSELAD